MDLDIAVVMIYSCPFELASLQVRRVIKDHKINPWLYFLELLSGEGSPLKLEAAIGDIEHSLFLGSYFKPGFALSFFFLDCLIHQHVLSAWNIVPVMA